MDLGLQGMDLDPGRVHRKNVSSLAGRVGLDHRRLLPVGFPQAPELKCRRRVPERWDSRTGTATATYEHYLYDYRHFIERISRTFPLTRLVYADMNGGGEERRGLLIARVCRTCADEWEQRHYCTGPVYLCLESGPWPWSDPAEHWQNPPYWTTHYMS